MAYNTIAYHLTYCNSLFLVSRIKAFFLVSQPNYMEEITKEIGAIFETTKRYILN